MPTISFFSPLEFYGRLTTCYSFYIPFLATAVPAESSATAPPVAVGCHRNNGRSRGRGGRSGGNEGNSSSGNMSGLERSKYLVQFELEKEVVMLARIDETKDLHNMDR